MTITRFATNKTFISAGITSDTMEPYVSVIGYHLVLRNNAIGGGQHFAPAMVVISTEYKEADVNRTEQRAHKAAAKAEAEARAFELSAA